MGMRAQKYFTDGDTIMAFCFDFKINARPFQISFFIHDGVERRGRWSYCKERGRGGLQWYLEFGDWWLGSESLIKPFPSVQNALASQYFCRTAIISLTASESE